MGANEQLYKEVNPWRKYLKYQQEGEPFPRAFPKGAVYQPPGIGFKMVFRSN